MPSSVPVSIIIPVWNGMADLPACLAALSCQQGIDFEIVVVDNASTDGSADYISRHYPQVRLLRHQRNQGFVRACNAGLRLADGDVLVLLNQDTEVYPNWLVALIAPLLSGSETGITGSKALFADGTIQHAGGYIDERGVGRSHAYGARDHQHHTTRAVHYVSGAALALTRRTYERIGELDEGFSPAYYEDTDWCRRARQAGLSVRYVPDSILMHKERSMLLSDDQRSHGALATLQRNRLRYVLKHWSIEDITQHFYPSECDWFQTLGWRGETLAAAAHDAYLHHLLHLSQVLDARRAAMTTTAQDVEILSVLLLQLRLQYPLAPAALNNMTPAATLDTGWCLGAKDPAPGGGCSENAARGLAAWQEGVRRRWPGLSLAALTWPVTRRLARVSHRQLLAEVLLAYVRENSREIGYLARELDHLRRQLDRACDSERQEGTDTDPTGAQNNR